MNAHNDLHDFSQWMTALSTLYNRSLSHNILDLYWQTLKRYDWKIVKAAFQMHMQHPDNGQYFPKPADIICLIEGDTKTQARDAWTLVRKAIQRVGAYHSVVFDDPRIHTVIDDMGGWVNLCQTKIDALGYRANEFQKRYQRLLIQPPPKYPSYCSGILERTHSIQDLHHEPPVRISSLQIKTDCLNEDSSKTLLGHATTEKELSHTRSSVHEEE